VQGEKLCFALMHVHTYTPLVSQNTRNTVLISSLKYTVVRNGVPVCRFLFYNSSGGVRLHSDWVISWNGRQSKNEPTPTTVGTRPETAIAGILTCLSSRTMHRLRLLWKAGRTCLLHSESEL